MANVSETLQLAMRFHRSGDLRQAEQLYARVVEQEPANTDAHHLWGVASLTQGRLSEAVTHLEHAVRLKESSAVFRHHLGVALGMAGRKQESSEHLRFAVARQPQSATVHNDLGGVLRELGQLAEAEACCREALRLDPNLVEAHNNLGNVLLDKNQWSQAQASLEHALALNPRAVEAHFGLGTCFQAQERWAEAALAFEQAIALKPDLAAAHHGLGSALLHLRRANEAAACQREAIRLHPQLAAAHNGLGAALQALGEIAPAKECYARALSLRPGDPLAQYNLGAACFAEGDYQGAEAYFRPVAREFPGFRDVHFRLGQCLQFQGDLPAALASYDRALAQDAAHAEAHYYRATTRLAAADFQLGWPEYEWRLRTRYAGPSYLQPRWSGQELSGQKIVVHAEWGLGDTLHFVRYVPWVERRGGDVFLAVQPSLVKLLQASGFRQVVAWRDDPLAQCQWQVPLLSLPGIFGTTIDTIPAETPYLAASPERTEKWRDRLKSVDGFKVGIHWQGSQSWRTDPRSIPPHAFEPLADIDGVRLISLQKTAPDDTLTEWDDRLRIVDFGPELDAAGGAFMDTAAIMQQLDLVITCDTGTAHLAGSLGVAVWVALPSASEWRWMRDREDSPWYPTMRLFRQTDRRDWSSVFSRIADELTTFAGRSPRC
ncbi:MAG TPA: tetratricopeptide repeat protein [Pirellulales bacterium]|nr:tetratricopeptide repeat protein [Pirellulales bacterium]